MYIINVVEDGFEDNFLLDVVNKLVVLENVEVVLICVKIEFEIIELDEVDKVEFLVELGMEELGLNCVICVGYNLLGL